MFDDYQICPYTGLRSFTEDESLYFKGREEDIEQATSQLQRNKFLMLTGASGDGKSSLVYAGIIPNARAGFLKSKYTNWCIADFRPERTPFQNLCKSIGKQLDITNLYTVQSELNHGFSAIIDLYKNSRKYIDTHSATWQNATDKERTAIKREAANLIILVDQFEEFFSNPENYQRGAPSRDANLVLNLLLETARIALEEDLPVYIVITMRSDFIGQCAAFRGLPEYIGFSQFFVPRLNRSQLQQVIEEPAKLSRNRITRRLTERLIHDLTEGVDQLPTLQHALNQVWVAADHGNEEMDLIHYAMVGGMSINELPEEDVSRFNTWFKELSPEIKACYHAPSLQNVLDTHTNKLYEQAAGYYTSTTGKNISVEDAKMIIRTAFTCLTKIDQGRAVRNRMTLQEITNILNHPTFGTTEVGNLLNIFREPGNTFIHPFIHDDDPETKQIQPNQVLDITHESLIRNWQWLGQWAREEFESHSVLLDFEKQFERWVNSGKSNNFLLPIGPLTYFENWYNKAKPNSWWIARYLPDEATKEARLEKANEILGNAREFLRRSVRKYAITRTIMRYGPKRIVATIGIIAFLTLTSFVIGNYYKKQNSYVLGSIHRQSLVLADDQKIGISNRILLIVEELKLGKTSIDEVINAVNGNIQKIKIANGISSLLVYQGQTEPKKEIFRALFLADSLLESFPYPGKNAELLSPLLAAINNERVILEVGYFYNPNPQIAEWRMRNANRSARLVMKIVDQQPENFNDIQQLTLALENAINYRAFSTNDIGRLLKIFSPFENGLQSKWLQSNFQQDHILFRGETNYGFAFNGLYQELAYLYGAYGNNARVSQCIDSLFKYGQSNFQNDYSTCGDNEANITMVYLLNHQDAKLDEFVNSYCARKKITPIEFYQRVIGRSIKSFDATGNLQFYNFQFNTQNLNLLFCNRYDLSELFEKFRVAIQSGAHDADEKNYLMALSYKNEGILKSLHHDPPLNAEPSSDDLFEKAFSYYHLVNPSYLQQSTPVVWAVVDQVSVPRSFLFIYPDYRTFFHPLEPRSFFYFYFSTNFIAYILSHNLFDTLYPTPAELRVFPLWLEDFTSTNIEYQAFLTPWPDYKVFKNLAETIAKRTDTKSIDLNILYLYLGHEAQDSGKQEEMLQYYDKLELNNLLNILHMREFVGLIRDQSFRMISYAIKGYSSAGQFDKAWKLGSVFKKSVNRSSLYAFAACEILREKGDSKVADRLIDSARAEMNRVENLNSEQPNRRILARALSMQSPSKNQSEVNALIKNLPLKFAAMEDISRSFAFFGRLYDGQAYIPDFTSVSDQADFLFFLFHGYAEGTEPVNPQWKEFIRNESVLFLRFILYIDENS